VFETDRIEELTYVQIILDSNDPKGNRKGVGITEKGKNFLK